MTSYTIPLQLRPQDVQAVVDAITGSNEFACWKNGDHSQKARNGILKFVGEYIKLTNRYCADKAREVYDQISWPAGFPIPTFESLLHYSTRSSTTCTVCNGTGDMGFTIPQRCTYCP